MKTLGLVVLVAALAFGSGVFAAPVLHRGPWAVRIGKSTGDKLAASGITSIGATVDWRRACFFPDGSYFIDLKYATASGTPLAAAQLGIDASCTRVLRDIDQGIVYTPTGGSDNVCTLPTSAVSRVAALISAGATGGKLNLP